MDYKRRINSSKDEGSKDIHATDGGEDVSPIVAKQEKGKTPYTREDKGKARQREFMLRLKCFLCDG